jgi:hypothetical protein
MSVAATKKEQLTVANGTRARLFLPDLLTSALNELTIIFANSGP